MLLSAVLCKQMQTIVTKEDDCSGILHIHNGSIMPPQVSTELQAYTLMYVTHTRKPLQRVVKIQRLFQTRKRRLQSDWKQSKGNHKGWHILGIAY